VEVLLAAAASAPSPPPPLADFLPDPTLTDLLLPTDPGLVHLLELVPRADVYLQDEVHIAMHPTLTRVWCAATRRGQRLVQAPGCNDRQVGFGMVDWRSGWFDWDLAPGRCAAPFCAQLRRAVERSTARDRIAIVILDNLGIHTPRGSKLLRALQEEYGQRLILVYTPSYDPESNRIAWLWRAMRQVVTHNHQRRTLTELLADANVWADALTPADALLHIGSPCEPDPTTAEAHLDHAA